jgi:hypothetical protein
VVQLGRSPSPGIYSGFARISSACVFTKFRGSLVSRWWKELLQLGELGFASCGTIRETLLN